MNHTHAPVSRSFALVFSIVPVFLASAIGSAATIPNIPGWYMNLVKPGFTPPNWIFGPVWTVLYIVIALACYRVLRKPGSASRFWLLVAYLVQAGLNAAWSIVFFGLHSPGIGLIVIGPLWASIVWTIFLFWRRDPLTGAVLLPYLAWVSFATALNAAIWSLNS